MNSRYKPAAASLPAVELAATHDPDPRGRRILRPAYAGQLSRPELKRIVAAAIG